MDEDYYDDDVEDIDFDEEDVYTDTDECCVYIKKNGTISDYLLKNYDITKSQKELEKSDSLDELLNTLQNQYNDDIKNDSNVESDIERI